MFPFMLFSTLFSSVFTQPAEQHWVCNSSDTDIWYTYCDDMKFPISLNVNPCITLKGTRGNLHVSYIPIKDLNEKARMFVSKVDLSKEKHDDDGMKEVSGLQKTSTVIVLTPVIVFIIAIIIYFLAYIWSLYFTKCSHINKLKERFPPPRF